MVGNTKYCLSSSAVGILGAIYKQEEEEEEEPEPEPEPEPEEEDNYLNTQMTTTTRKLS